jgi:hypothetical protein
MARLNKLEYLLANTQLLAEMVGFEPTKTL